MAALVMAFAVGCEPTVPLPGDVALVGTAQPLTGENGLSLQGLSLQGLSLQGLSLQGLSLQGLSLQGLSTTGFNDWFQEDPTLGNEVMKYLVGCAVPAGESRTYTSSSTGLTYTWNGVLGVAAGWASGQAATTAELQVVSACMAAHANKYSAHVTISLLGLDGAGNPIPSTREELVSHRVREACFFGNLFDGSTGTFAANDGLSLARNESTTRVCGIPDASGTSQCSPMVYLGRCSQFCTQDPTGTYYTSCTYNGVNYRPITTRIQSREIYRCGDRVCQATESCGAGATPNHCAPDCGVCP